MIKNTHTGFANMAWKGSKLMCNGVCVAQITNASGGGWVVVDNGVWRYETRKAARAHVNRHFKLSVDFGAKP